MLLVRIENGQVRFTQNVDLGANESRELSLPTETSTVEELADAMVNELTQAGLFQKEALAMVNTWHASWFGEDGTRMLYLVPEIRPQKPRASVPANAR